MTFLATASGLMMERVRSTAILPLRLNKSEEIQDYIMTRWADCGACASKTPGGAGAPKAKAEGSPYGACDQRSLGRTGRHSVRPDNPHIKRVAPEPMERRRARGSRNDEAAVLSCGGIPDQAQSLFAGGSLKRDIHTDPGYRSELISTPDE